MSTSPQRLAPAPEALEPAPEDLPRMTLMQHLEELRKRISWVAGGLLLSFGPCWIYHKQLYAFLEAPIRPYLPPGQKLAFLGVADAFLLYFKVAALAAVFLASPFVLWQLWRFVAPALYRKEKLYAIPFIFFGSFFFLAGGAFAYYVAVPLAIKFLLDIGNQFQAMITIEKYFSFLLTVILGLGLMFEMPILIFLLAGLGVVTPGFLLRHFRWAVVLIFLAAAIITPTPDIVNLCVFALPAIGLYLLGIAAAAVVFRNRKKKAAAAEEAEAA
ncbi:MAG TPA: twin-arginine translocase subunit TatC [Thermoanaerobaculia bacterium]|nr:twin-arginine translocase subunit TatC [Thermoanaerobaculia bacterium]